MSAKLRAFQNSDIEPINDIWEKHYSKESSLPNRNNSIVDAVVEDNGRIIGYGQVRLFAEGMCFVDKDLPKRARVEALLLLMTEAFRGCNITGIEDMYCFIRDPQFASLMSKHFSFEIVDDPGELLLRKV